MTSDQIKLIRELSKLCDDIKMNESIWQNIDPRYMSFVNTPIERRVESIVTELHESFIDKVPA